MAKHMLAYVGCTSHFVFDGDIVSGVARGYVSEPIWGLDAGTRVQISMHGSNVVTMQIVYGINVRDCDREYAAYLAHPKPHDYEECRDDECIECRWHDTGPVCACGDEYCDGEQGDTCDWPYVPGGDNTLRSDVATMCRRIDVLSAFVDVGGRSS